MRVPRLHPLVRVLCGVILGAVVSLPLVGLVARARGAARPAWSLVPEDASGPLRRVAIHYAPSLDGRALPIWRALFAALPADIDVEVAVAEQRDFDRFVTALGAAHVEHLERFHAVPVHHELTTWSRDRMAALAGPDGAGAVLAPPRVETPAAGRAGDWFAPFALAREVYRADAHVADFVFEGGDLAASRHHIFADANLIGRNLGRGEATRAHLEDELRRTFAQDLIWLGDEPGEVPQHHVMMYMVPLDDDTVAVGDVRLGATLLASEKPRDLRRCSPWIQISTAMPPASIAPPSSSRRAVCGSCASPWSSWRAAVLTSRTPTRSSIAMPAGRSFTCQPITCRRSTRSPATSTRRSATASSRSTCRRSTS